MGESFPQGVSPTQDPRSHVPDVQSVHLRNLCLNYGSHVSSSTDGPSVETVDFISSERKCETGDSPSNPSIMKRQPKRGIVKAWSDATPNDGALVQEWDELDIIATTNFTPQQVQIFEAELATAVWGAIAAPGPVDLLIDNTAVAYAIAKGHSTSEKGNALLRLLFTHATVNSVSWVATHLQRADGPSRGDWNLPPRNANVEKKNIVSFFF